MRHITQAVVPAVKGGHRLYQSISGWRTTVSPEAGGVCLLSKGGDLLQRSFILEFREFG